jgi:hypothetical protein
MGFVVKSRYLFSALILLIVMLLMLIGYLADQLFSLDTTGLAARRQPANRLGSAPYGGSGMAVSETLITVGDRDESSPSIAQTAAVAVVSTAIAAHVIPTVCENFGPEIASRDAFSGPVTHWVEVAPNRIVFHLNTVAHDREAQGAPTP